MLPSRNVLLSSLALAALEALLPKRRHGAAQLRTLPALKPGVLEIHHIATNRGNSALWILPNGSTMMV